MLAASDVYKSDIMEIVKEKKNELIESAISFGTQIEKIMLKIVYL